MFQSLNRIAFVLEDLSVPSPGQQLLDRFLFGYPLDGRFHRLDRCQCAVYLPRRDFPEAVQRRVKDYGLIPAGSLENAVEKADAVLVVGPNENLTPNRKLLAQTLTRAPAECSVFVHGALSARLQHTEELLNLAAARNQRLLSGTSLGATWRLPEVELPLGTALRESLIVVQGPLPQAEFNALESILPIIERRRGGESGVKSVRYFQDEAIWAPGAKKLWSWQLLTAALSRSDTPQGDPVNDGRTQDLAGLGLVPKLARAPRCWILEHRDGLRTALFVLNGVIADFNFAVKTSGGQIVSAQIYRPPPPAEHQFSRLAAVVEKFFQTRTPPWNVKRARLISGLLERFADSAARSDRPLPTPELALPY